MRIHGIVILTTTTKKRRPPGGRQQESRCISLSIHTPEKQTGANMNRVCHRCQLGKTLGCKEEAEAQISPHPPLPLGQPLLFPCTPRGPSCLPSALATHPHARSFGRWRAINRTFFKKKTIRKRHLWGLKPNSPDDRFRSCTSSKWDFNPYVRRIRQPRARGGLGGRTDRGEGRSALWPAPAAMPGTGPPRPRPPASPPPLPQRLELLSALLIVSKTWGGGGGRMARKERKKRKRFLLIGLLLSLWVESMRVGWSPLPDAPPPQMLPPIVSNSGQMRGCSAGHLHRPSPGCPPGCGGGVPGAGALGGRSRLGGGASGRRVLGPGGDPGLKGRATLVADLCFGFFYAT